MAVNVMGAIWETSLPTNPKMILLRLADAADPDGSNSYPSIGALAHYTGLSRTTVKSYLSQFREEGLLVSTGSVKGGRGRMTNYTVMFARAQKLYPLPPLQKGEPRGVTFASDPPSQADLAQVEAEKLAEQKGSDPPEKGSDDGQKGSEALTPNHPIEPSPEPGARAGGGAAAPKGAAPPGDPLDVARYGSLAAWWRREVIPKLAERFGDVETQIWFQHAIPHGYDEEREAFIIAAPTRFLRAELDKRFSRHLVGLFGVRVDVEVTAYAHAAWRRRKGKSA